MIRGIGSLGGAGRQARRGERAEMMGWWCASLSFWSGAGLLGALALWQALGLLRGSRRSRVRAASPAGELLR